MTKREHLKQELENLINGFIFNDEDCPTDTSIAFSVHQSQGLNIEDFEIYLEIVTASYDISTNEATGEETHSMDIEGYCLYQTRLLQEETVTKEEFSRLYPHTYTFGDSIDNLIDLVETEIQKLTQWNSENTVEISILDLPYIPLKNPFTAEEEDKPIPFNPYNEFDIAPIIPEEEPIILFDEDGNRIKY